MAALIDRITGQRWVDKRWMEARSSKEIPESLSAELMPDFSQFFFKSLGNQIVLQMSSFTGKPGDKGARASAACLMSPSG